MKRLWLCALALVVGSTVLRAQTLAAAAAQVPAFDVVSVKPSSTSENRMMLMYGPDGFHSVNLPLLMLLRTAFGVEDDQIIGAPDWVKSTNFDVEGKVDAADAEKLKTLTPQQRGTMIQSIFLERFGLKFHREERELPVYDLVVAKGGLKMKEAPPLPEDTATPPKARGQMRMQPGKLTAQAVTIGVLVNQLSNQRLGRSVIDKTGLKGHYDFTLEWMPEGGIMINGAPAPPPPPGSPAEASIFTAVQEQLGLKLEPRKDMLPVIVIDHIEKPTAN